MDDDVVRAELLSLPWRLSLALAEAPFILEPHSALSLPVRAKAAAERAMRLATVRDRTTTRTLPQLLANRGGAVNRLLKSASKGINRKDLAESEKLKPREVKAELAELIEKLASFQISRFRTQDFKLALLLAERCVYRHGESSRGSSERSAAVNRSVRAFRDWMREAVNVLEEAWKQHRVKIDVDDLHEQGESQQRLCYSKAPEVDYYSGAQEDEDLWLRLFPIPRWAIFDEDKDTYEEYIHETRVNTSGLFAAGGVATGGSYRVIDLLDDEGGRDGSEDGDDDWFLSPRLACNLYTTLLRVAYDDADDTFFEVRVPKIAKPYCKDDRWMDNLQQCALRLAARLEKGIFPRPNCTGEEVVLHITFNYDILDDIDVKPEIFRSTKDDDVEELEEYLMEDSDIRLLYSFDPDSRVWDIFRVANMHPAEWFKPFDPNRFLEHIMIKQERRPEKVEHAIAVLSKARRPLHDRLLLSKIVSYLDDSDIIRLTCCGKANNVE